MPSSLRYLAESSRIPRMEIIIPIILLLGGIVYLFNRLVRAKNLVEAAWSDVDVQLKRRHDLIPNLVTTVKAYSTHESDTLEEITRLRTESSQESSIDKRAKLEQGITGDMKRLMLLVESYPDLKADKNFRDLQASLIKVEDDLQYSRRYYNGAVRDLNNLAESFPVNMVAKVFGFTTAEFFEVDRATEGAAPKILL